MRAISLICANTFKEALRQKLLLLVALVALVLIASSKYFLRLDMGHEQLHFIFDFGSGALGFFGSIIAITSVCQLFHSEFDNKTATTLLARPVSSANFIFGKVFGACLVLAIFSVAVTLATAIMLYYTREVFEAKGAQFTTDVNYAGLFVYALIQWLKLCSIAAITSLVCAVSRSLLFSIVMSFLVLAISIMGEASFALGVKLSRLTKIAASAFPDFNIFSVSEAFVFTSVELVSALSAMAYAVIYIVVAGLAASWIFSRREF